MAKYHPKAPTIATFTNKPPVPYSDDLHRILGLQRREPPAQDSVEAQALIELMTARLRKPLPRHCDCLTKYHRKHCILTLRFAQAWALYEMGLTDGLYGSIGVGWGKTGIAILAPRVLRNCHCVVLLLPANVTQQLVDEYLLMEPHWQVPSLISHAPKIPFKNDIGPPYVHVVPYTILSLPNASDKLSKLRPDTFIADEMHNIAAIDSARTSRVLRQFRDNGNTRFIGMSGTPTNKSIKDSAHLQLMALKAKAPIPIIPETLDAWADALDPVDVPTPAGALRLLCPGVPATIENVREGFRERATQTLGVVATIQSVVADIELNLQELEAPEPPPEIKRALQVLRDEWQRPDGEILLDAMSVNRCALELACGFYYKWVFPRGMDEALIDEWRAARKAWFSELRQFVAFRKEHLDSPFLCQQAAQRAWGETEDDHATDFAQDEDEIETAQEDQDNFDEAGGTVTVHASLEQALAVVYNPRAHQKPKPLWKAVSWPRWAKVRKLVKPTSVAERMSPFLAEFTASWALRNTAVIWYARRAFGVWVAELSGLPLHGGGVHAGKLINAEKGDRSIIASIKSHGVGRNGLQFKFHQQLFTNPHSSSIGWEQALGRLHRPGQESPVVYGWFFRHTPEMQRCVDLALKRALYVQQTTGNIQKIVANFLDLQSSDGPLDMSIFND